MKMAHEIETVQELLDQWDAGGTFFTIECGGLGPGYEQALQVAAVELARANQTAPMTLTADEEKDCKTWDDKCTKTLFGGLDAQLGLSGSQFGAAKWLAWNWCFKGGPKALTDLAKADGKEDRIIQVSNAWPLLKSTTTQREQVQP